MRDLFGDIPQKVEHTNAYAGTPGAGPDGMTCRQCSHYSRVQSGAGIYRKCGLNQHRWTHGQGCDIKASTPACYRFTDPETV